MSRLTLCASDWWQLHWVTESSWIHFKLHWIDVRGFKCDSVCTTSQKTLNFWHHLHFLVPEKIRGVQVRLVSKVMATARPKAPVAMSLTCWYVCGIVRVHLRADTFVFHWGLFLRVKFWAKLEPASLLTQKCACLVFVKVNFFIFIIRFFAKCTCKIFALKWLSCRGRAAARNAARKKLR